MSEWREITLGDFIALQRGHDLPSHDRGDGDVPVMGSFGVTGYHSIPKADGPGVTVGRSGASIGTVSFIEEDYWPLNTCMYVTDFKGNYPRFVFHFLSTLNLARFNSGSAQPSLNRNYIYPIEIRVPAFREQREIAAILGALDDKIELNRKTAATLEEMARALYRSWFVDFDPVWAKLEGRAPAHMDAATAALFPDRFGDEGLPEGWVLTRTEDLSAKIAMGPFGSNIKVSTFVEKGVPIISGHHLHGTMMKHGDHKFIMEDHADRLKNSNVFEGDIVFTHAGTIGQVAMIGTGSGYDRFVISQRQFFLRPDKKKVSPFFLLMFFKSARGQHELLSNASQVGVPSIARPSSHLKAIEICVPKAEVMRCFDEEVSRYFQKISLIEQENQTLATLRDTLLPRLMSGDLRVGEAREQVEDLVE
ncbi:restriction endonuclease subunit S [Roseibium sp. CAU 1637]|uniref:Restriction endonuclease subunit S n=1 Tax=Roseibium limicola TaxID=2816037 RepID=A0A939J8I5_9HYPH|nr:restriction endonuclease subunit S [Roseibium limicola]MBO0344393.1 restriction endonuclease subunit S [Roseibium limicola]